MRAIPGERRQKSGRRQRGLSTLIQSAAKDTKMTDRSYAHEAIAWARHRLDELDGIISQVKRSAADLRESAHKEADRAISGLKESRARLQQSYDSLRSQAEATRDDVQKVLDAIDTEWVEVESEFQSFLSAAKEDVDTVRGVVAARAQAQRRAWEASLKGLRDQANDAVEKARGEFDAAIKRLTDETEKFQGRIAEVKDAGDESWKAVKSRLADAKSVQDRALQKIKESFSRLL